MSTEHTVYDQLNELAMVIRMDIISHKEMQEATLLLIHQLKRSLELIDKIETQVNQLD